MENIYKLRTKNTKLVRTKAFTLAELSVVLVIIGLLAAGIVGGQSLIESSKIARVISDYKKYASAVNTFKAEYNGMPGDLYNATNYWTAYATPANCGTVSLTGNDICNGDGDGDVDYDYDNSQYETFYFWRMLSLGKLINGSFSGASTGTCANPTRCYEEGKNVPAAPFANTLWTAFVVPHGWYTSLSGKNVLAIGSKTETISAYGWGGRWHNNALTPLQQKKIDDKMDDGRPLLGKIQDMKIPGFETYYTPSCTTNEATTDPDYNLTEKRATCIILMEIEN